MTKQAALSSNISEQLENSALKSGIAPKEFIRKSKVMLGSVAQSKCAITQKPTSLASAISEQDCQAYARIDKLLIYASRCEMDIWQQLNLIEKTTQQTFITTKLANSWLFSTGQLYGAHQTH